MVMENLFEKGVIIGTHQAKKTFNEFAKATKIGLRTVHLKWDSIVFKEAMWSEKPSQRIGIGV